MYYNYRPCCVFYLCTYIQDKITKITDNIEKQELSRKVVFKSCCEFEIFVSDLQASFEDM